MKNVKTSEKAKGFKVDFERLAEMVILDCMGKLRPGVKWQKATYLISQHVELKLMMTFALSRIIRSDSTFVSEEHFVSTAQYIASHLKELSKSFVTMIKRIDGDGIEVEREIYLTRAGITYDIYHEFLYGESVNEYRFPEGVFLNISNLTIALAKAFDSLEETSLKFFSALKEKAGQTLNLDCSYGNTYNYPIFASRFKDQTEHLFENLAQDIVGYLAIRADIPNFNKDTCTEEIAPYIKKHIDPILYSRLSDDKKKLLKLLICFELHRNQLKLPSALSVDQLIIAALKLLHFYTYSQARKLTRIFFQGVCSEDSPWANQPIELPLAVVVKYFPEEAEATAKQAVFDNFCGPLSK